MRQIGLAVGMDSLPLKQRPTDCPETSVKNYHYSLRNNLQECSSLMKEGVHFEKIIFTWKDNKRVIKGIG
jgi:hypothetical protein